MLESQLARKARLDPHRRDVQFKPGDEVLLDTTHRHSSPFPRQALTTLDGLAPSACSPRHLRIPNASTIPRAGAFNVERLRRYLRRPPALPVGGDDEEQVPVQGLDGQLEHEVEAII